LVYIFWVLYFFFWGVAFAAYRNFRWRRRRRLEFENYETLWFGIAFVLTQIYDHLLCPRQLSFTSLISLYLFGFCWLSFVGRKGFLHSNFIGFCAWSIEFLANSAAGVVITTEIGVLIKRSRTKGFGKLIRGGILQHSEKIAVEFVIKFNYEYMTLYNYGKDT